MSPEPEAKNVDGQSEAEDEKRNEEAPEEPNPPTEEDG